MQRRFISRQKRGKVSLDFMYVQIRVTLACELGYFNLVAVNELLLCE